MSADAKHPAARPSLAESAQDREQLRALLKAAEHSSRYRVVRQVADKGEVIELTVCGHRFEVMAELCAYRWTMRHRTAPGGHYTVRRADA